MSQNYSESESFHDPIGERVAKSNKRTVSTRAIILSSAFAAIAVDLLVYPIDTLKTRLQSPDYKSVYAGPKNRKILFSGLYQGIAPVAITTIPAAAAFFTTYEITKKTFNALPFPQPVINCMASTIAELAACAILTPSEVIKQNAQIVLRSKQQQQQQQQRGGKFSSVSWETFKKFKNNPMNLFKGYLVLVGKNIPYTAFQFPLYEYLREKWGGVADLQNLTEERDKNLWRIIRINAFAAGVSGGLAAMITTPIDVLKTRVMLSASSVEGSPSPYVVQEGKNDGKSSSVTRMNSKYLEIAKSIVRKEGFGGLWRGIWLRGVWTFFGMGIFLGAYEGGKIWLSEEEEPEK